MANGVYLYGHGPVIGLLAILLYVRRRPVYRLTRNAVLISGAIGLVIYVAFPVAPPRLLPDTQFVDTVLDEYQVRRVLMPSFLTNEYAAVPSLHFGWNVLMAAAVWMAFDNLLARGFAIVMPVAMFLAIVVTANHYILDAVAGAVVVVAGAWLALHLRDFTRGRLKGDGPWFESARWLLGTSPKLSTQSQPA